MATKRKRYGWTKPRWRDPLFLLAFGITAALGALQIVLIPRDSWAGWGSIAIRTLVVWVLISAVLRIRRGMSKGLVDGYVEAEQKAAAKPSGQSTSESVARTSGRAVGKAIAAYKRTK